MKTIETGALTTYVVDGRVLKDDVHFTQAGDVKWDMKQEMLPTQEARLEKME